MALTGSPIELLEEIIQHVLPEGFESLALTCKGTYALCTPLIDHHNKLRSDFRDFNYGNFEYPLKMIDPSSTIRTAWDLIGPLWDGTFPGEPRHRDMHADVTDPRSGEAVIKLLARSPHLKQAGIDWKEFHAEIEDDLEERRYSQNAAVFLLTLLPNVEVLWQPRKWKPNSATHKLFDVIVREAKAKQSHLPWNGPALASVTTFNTLPSFHPSWRHSLDEVVPFLTLPNVEHFHGPCSVAMDDFPIGTASKDPYRAYGERLVTVDLRCSCVNEVSITEFLRHTPRLKTLKYSHSVKGSGDQRDWDICKFVTVIGQEVGVHLEELSISIGGLRGSILPGNASMRGFQCLQKLKFPLEIAMCNFNFATTMDPTFEYSEAFLSDLVPVSVSQLALLSDGKYDHQKALDAMFRHFASRKDVQLPALKEFYLSCPTYPPADSAYQEQCTNLAVEAEKVGVVLDLVRTRGIALSWNADQKGIDY